MARFGRCDAWNGGGKERAGDEGMGRWEEEGREEEEKRRKGERWKREGRRKERKGRDKG